MTFRVSLFITVAAAALVLGASRANAELLLYDGFATVTDGDSRTPYMSSSDTHKLQDANAKSEAWTTGVSKNYPWSEQSGVIFTFRNAGLALPADFAEGTDDQFSARGGSAGYSNSSAPDTDLRAKNRAITSTMPTSGKLYYRCLMKIDSTTLNSLKTTSWRYYRTGISATPAANAYDNQANLKNNGLQIGFTSPGASPQRVDIGVNIGGQYSSVLQNISAGTTYIAIAELDYDNGTANVYVSPIGDYSKTFAWTVENLAVASAVTASAMKVMCIDGSYKTNGGKVMFDEIAVGTKLSDVAVVTPATVPQLGAVALARTGAAAYAVTAEVLENAADTVSWIADNGAAAPTTNVFASAVATNTTASGTVSGLATDKTYQISVLAENAGGADDKVAGTIYTGSLSLGATTDANEYGLVAGGVTVSRAAADPFPLTVNYTISGSAGTEGTTWAAPVAVTIPAGSASATLPVVPLMDGDVVADVTITVALAAGNYEIPAVASATLTLFNIVPPAGTNTWIAVADGLASVGSNWSSGLPPTSSDDVLFDGRFSSANCTWDAPAAVASWTQTAEYDGTVEFQTTYADGAFPIFSITGDCTVNGGKWTHHSNTNVASGAAAQYRLNVSVGGDFTLGSGARIDLVGRGYNVGRCPAGSQVGVHAATARGTYAAVYGNVYAPEDVGSGGEAGGQYGQNVSCGGGAVKLAVAGAAVIDGTVAATASRQYLTGNPEKGYGAGGSVFITASSISGSGTADVSAHPAGVSETAYTGYAGSGGRMALVATAGSVTIPMANLLAEGSHGSYTAGGGTIFLKNAADTNGSLLVGTTIDSWSFSVRYVRKDGCTCVKPGETWTFDHVYVRDRGILSIPANATLSLPGGFESVSSLTSSSTPFCGLLYLGGTISLPARVEHVLSGPWMFMAAEPFTFAGDVRLSSQASIGVLQLFADSLAAYPACQVSVTGDMTVESGATLYANNRGRRGADVKTQSYHGGSVAVTTHHLNVYDSIFNPSLCGTSGRSGNDYGATNPGGGAIILTVGGCLTLNGSANAGSTDPKSGNHVGAAGSICITAGSLAGTGNITANGASGSSAKSRGAGGGGRVSVRLTDAGATFADFSGAIQARGDNGNSATTTAGSSAGTVYLQDGNTAAGAGTIRVANISPSTAVDARTGFPSLSNGEPIDDLSKASLEIANNSRIVLIADVKVESVNIESGSSIDLNGHSITVRAARAGGVKIPPGVYADGATLPIGVGTLDDYLLDTAAGGSLVVRSRTTFILLQ